MDRQLVICQARQWYLGIISELSGAGQGWSWLAWQYLVMFQHRSFGRMRLSVGVLELGRDVLQALARRGVSVVFSTQITSLAQYAEADLNAICVQFDDLHRVKPGIGDGGMNRLRERFGTTTLRDAWIGR